jgi:ribulose kinase
MTDRYCECISTQVLELGETVGGLTAAAAAHLGLPAGVPVAQGGADAFVGMLGLGVVSPNQLALITGSSHLLLGLATERFHGEGLFGTYADALLPGTHVVEGGQTSTGSVVNWFKKLLGSPEVRAPRRACSCDCKHASVLLPQFSSRASIMYRYQSTCAAPCG